MRYERYQRIDNAIQASDSGGAFQRWRYGRRCVCDDEMTTPKGNLRDGKMEWLIRHSGASRREIQYRLQCAKAYPKESQLRMAIAQYGSWFALTRAGFPPFEGDPDERPYNPLETDELAKQHETATQRIVEDSQYVGGALIPRDAFPDNTPMPEIDRWTDQELELQARGLHRAQERRFYVDGLIKAGGSGWRGMTLGECERAFHDSDD
jgi:hypothetical protein